MYIYIYICTLDLILHVLFSIIAIVSGYHCSTHDDHCIDTCTCSDSAADLVGLASDSQTSWRVLPA